MKDVRIAYLLVVHKNPEQVNIFLTQLLNYGDCDIYIHADKKNAGLCDSLIKDERIIVCSEYDVRWGSVEIVKSAIKLMRMVIKSGKIYTHFYFGSGQDLLVKKGMYNYLAEYPDNIFLHIRGKVTDKDRGSARYRVRWPKKLMIRNDYHLYRFVRIFIQFLCKAGFVFRRNQIDLRNKVEFYYGETWFIAPYEIMTYILDYMDKNPDYEKFWEESLAPDLMFFQTIIMNSPYAEKLKDELMYVRAGKTFGTMNHPLTVQIKDIPQIEEGTYFCARKFELDTDPEALQYFVEKTRME